MLSLVRADTYRIGGLLAVCSVLLTSTVLLAGETPIPVGDPRSGYERADYRSASRRLDLAAERQLDLAALAARPPLGLPRLEEVPQPGAIDLGRRLFFDRRLSVNATLSCGMCHIPEQGFAQNELATPVGMEGRSVRRNAPALYNVAFRSSLFLDGRTSSLETQIWEPLLADNEMANRSREQVLQRLAGIADYQQAFRQVFATKGITERTLAVALASYQRALLSADSRFDRWYYGGDPAALDATEQRGFAVFQQAGCNGCHSLGERDALFSNGQFYNTGIAFATKQRPRPEHVQLAPGVFVRLADPPSPARLPDAGRAEVTGDPADRWKYAVPSLRNVALTAPYMHDGSVRSLEEVIAYYRAGGSGDPAQDALIKPLAINDTDAAALVAFLRSLTGSNVLALALDARSAGIGDHD